MKQRFSLSHLTALSFLIALCLLVGHGPFGLCMAAEPDGPAVLTGSCGDDLTWTLTTETGELIISGTGAMWETPPEGIQEQRSDS